jgi:hypothetical protein
MFIPPQCADHFCGLSCHNVKIARVLSKEEKRPDLENATCLHLMPRLKCEKLYPCFPSRPSRFDG